MIQRYETRGRRVLVQFTCGRCGKKHIENYSKQCDAAEHNLQSFKPPEGWQDDSLYTPLLCEKCAKAYRAFLRGEATYQPGCEPAELPQITDRARDALVQIGAQAHGEGQK